MNKKIVLTALLLLIALKGFSQEDTVRLPFITAKKIALDLVDYDRLKAVEKVNSLQLAKYSELVPALHSQIKNKDLQIGLLQANNKSLEDQLKIQKPKYSWNDFKNDALLFLTGVAVGIGILFGA